MNEYRHLINDYLCVNSMICNAGFHAISAEQCGQFLHNLVPFERPDMYANLDDAIIILEHFEFDASKHTQKGMKGKAEEAHLQQRMEQATPDGQIHIDGVNYSISLQDWQANFERCFQHHYERIDIYKSRVADRTGNSEKPILVGFFVENQFSPIVNISGDIAELLYWTTIQFANVILNSPKLDFVLFGGYINGKEQITYIDKIALENIYDSLINLQDKRVTLTPINNNEVVLHGGFQITREDIENA